MENNEDKKLTNEEVTPQAAQTNVSGAEAPESVWADGVPANIKEEDKLTTQQMIAMAIKYISEQVIVQKGFKIEPGFPRMANPNIVCQKDGKTYAIIVFPSVYPQFVGLSDDFRKKFVEMVKKNGGIALFAPVGYRSTDEERAKAGLALKGDVFRVTFPGFLELGEEEHLDYTTIKPEDYFRP